MLKRPLLVYRVLGLGRSCCTSLIVPCVYKAPMSTGGAMPTEATRIDVHGHGPTPPTATTTGSTASSPGGRRGAGRRGGLVRRPGGGESHAPRDDEPAGKAAKVDQHPCVSQLGMGVSRPDPAPPPPPTPLPAPRERGPQASPPP